jgi:hypothetical protein
VEKIFSPTDDTRTPLCLEGKRNCPPEDCGSIPGYERITELLRKKSRTEDDEELLEWLGDEYDPEFFDIEDTNATLRPTKCIKSKTRTVKGGGKKTGK